MMDILDMTDDQITDLAVLAFKRGLSDGRVKSQPITAEYLMNSIMPPHGRRLLHNSKFRQIYGAGFDMARAKIRIAEKEGA
jgi:hypothetical protein